jgi:hypothetical protein
MAPATAIGRQPPLPDLRLVRAALQLTMRPDGACQAGRALPERHSSDLSARGAHSPLDHAPGNHYGCRLQNHCTRCKHKRKASVQTDRAACVRAAAETNVLERRRPTDANNLH